MFLRGKSPCFAVTDIEDDFFDTRKPWTNFAIGEISVEKAILIMNPNFILGFLGPPLRWVSIILWSPARQIKI